MASQPELAVACLAKRAELRPACKKAVFETRKEQAQDMRLDPALLEACGKEVKEFCTDVDFGGGNKKDCLFESRVRVWCLV